jgi:hypothetical protein
VGRGARGDLVPRGLLGVDEQRQPARGERVQHTRAVRRGQRPPVVGRVRAHRRDTRGPRGGHEPGGLAHLARAARQHDPARPQPRLPGEQAGQQLVAGGRIVQPGRHVPGHRLGDAEPVEPGQQLPCGVQSGGALRVPAQQRRGVDEHAVHHATSSTG